MRHNRHGPKIRGYAPLGSGAGSHLTQCCLGRGLHPTKWHLDSPSLLATTDVDRKLGVCPFGGLGHLTQCGQGRGLPYNKWYLDLSSRLATTDMAENWGSCCALSGSGAGSPSNTMWPGTRPTSVPSFILIHPTVWPQTGQTVRHTGQRSDSIRRNVLQAVTQNIAKMAYTYYGTTN